MNIIYEKHKNKIVVNIYSDINKDEVIHHINNNGYDCRPDNLIPLRPREHSKAHGFFVSSDKWEN